MILKISLHVQHKEETMLAKLRDSEHLQLVTEMRRRIAELEIQVNKISRFVPLLNLFENLFCWSYFLSVPEIQSILFVRLVCFTLCCVTE